MSRTVDKHARWVGWIGAVVAPLSLAVALISYCHQVNESRSRRETIVLLDAAMNWDGAYFGGFRVDTVARVQADGKYKLEHHYFGFAFYVDANIYNASQHAISVKKTFALHVLDGLLTTGTVSYRGYEHDLVTPMRFPIFLEPQQQAKISIRIDWPISQSIASVYADLERDKVYDWETIVDIYQRSSEEPFLGSVFGGPPSGLLGLLAKHQFNTREDQEYPSEHKIKVCARLASGEVYWAQVESL